MDTHLKEAKRKKMKTEEEKIYYVSMTDRFMSGWGEAKGRINKLIFVCQGYEAAKIVEDNAHERNEMKYINICMNKPYYNARHYLAEYKTKEDSKNWYIENYFRGRNALE